MSRYEPRRNTRPMFFFHRRLPAFGDRKTLLVIGLRLTCLPIIDYFHHNHHNVGEVHHVLHDHVYVQYHSRSLICVTTVQGLTPHWCVVYIALLFVKDPTSCGTIQTFSFVIECRNSKSKEDCNPDWQHKATDKSERSKDTYEEG
jgi:hypothetical protein